MKLRTRERYSLRMVMAIAGLSSKDAPAGLGEVSDQTGISRRYLEQLAPALKEASIIRSIPGRTGGYFLARPADDIALGQIIEAAIGPIALTECAIGADDCPKREHCNAKGLWAMINHRVIQVINEYTLKDLLDDGWLDHVDATILKG